jgi:YD repeat-containing protein
MLNDWTLGLKMVTRCIMPTPPAGRAVARFQKSFLGLWLFLCLLSPLLQGCDITIFALAEEGVFSKKSSKSSSSTTTPPPPDLSYALYVGNFSTPTLASNEATNLTNNGGNPSSPPWTFVGRGTATKIWGSLPPGMNAVLIQGPLTQVYSIDTFERLDANDAVIEVPTSTNVYANSAVSGTLSNGSGMMDGLVVTTVITDPAHSPCVFALFSQSVTSVRVRLWGAAQASGDCVWSSRHELSNTDAMVLGNASANSTGTLFASFVDTTFNQSFIIPFAASGSKGSPVSISTSASSSGGISVAVDSSDNVFVASALSTGNIQLQKYSGGSTTAQWAAPATYVGTAGSGTNTIGPHSLAVASNVPLVVTPGINGSALFLAGSQGPSGTHTLARFDDNTSAGVLIWGPKTISDPSNKVTAWSGVSTSSSTAVLTTGDLSNTTSGNIEILTQNSDLATGSVVWPSPVTSTGGGAATNNGNAIGSDTQGFAYVAGNFGSAANGKDSVVLRYAIFDGSGLTTFYKNSVFSGPNEFLGVAVDTDGTTYAVGYITQSNLVSTTATGAVTSWWIGKFSPTGLVPIWTATFNFGTGNDQAVSVSISGNYLYVVGSETVPLVPGPGTKVGVRAIKFLR